MLQRAICVSAVLAAAPFAWGDPATPAPSPPQAQTFATDTIVFDIRLWLDVLLDVHPPLRTAAGELGCETPVTDRIAGEFDGWHGDTTFVLANGQIWKQLTNQIAHANKHDPTVLVYELDGMCRLKVTGMTDEILVGRLR